MTFSGEDTRISLAGQASPKVIGECLVSIDPIMTKGTRKQRWLEVNLTLHYNPIKVQVPAVRTEDQTGSFEGRTSNHLFLFPKIWCLQGKSQASHAGTKAQFG